ncbi:transketolase [bacterium]|nr:transketolase [bacterium]
MRIENVNIKKARHDILTMTTISASGHPGGALSSLEILFATYISAGWYKEKIGENIVVSNGHVSAGVYTVLGHLGVIPLNQALAFFRYPKSPFEGHIENHIPGIAWSTGNLGQGLSAACGFALNEKLKNSGKFAYCVMGDAEQAKGQTAEARKWAKHHKLNNLIGIIDRNHIQISGRTEKVMNVNIEKDYEADGWKLIKVKGNDLNDIYNTIQKLKTEKEGPYIIIAGTTMGNGVSLMEDKPDYHGKTLTPEEYEKISKELGFTSEYIKFKEMRDTGNFKKIDHINKRNVDFIPPEKELKKERSDLRGMWGNYLANAAEKNENIIVFDCDLSSSVKTKDFWKNNPTHFFESGVMEHNIATLSGALSRGDFNVFWADFGMFNLSEVYNQMRLNDINNANLNIIATHIGIDVGEDGKTHQEIDYIGLLKNLFGFKLFLPADYNHLQHIFDHVFANSGNKYIGMGRSKLDPIKKEDGTPFYNENYKYEYGKVDEIRKGNEVWIISTGQVAGNGQKACEILEKKGISAALFHIATPLFFDDNFFNDKVFPKKIITIEDHNVNSGLGVIIAEKFGDRTNEIIKIGIDKYFYSGNAKILYDLAGLSPEKIANRVFN